VTIHNEVTETIGNVNKKPILNQRVTKLNFTNFFDIPVVCDYCFFDINPADVICSLAMDPLSS